MTTESKKPEFEAFAVVERKNQKPWYHPLGAVFRTASGDGLNVVLHATPLDGRILLLPFRERPKQGSDTE